MSCESQYEPRKNCLKRQVSACFQTNSDALCFKYQCNTEHRQINLQHTGAVFLITVQHKHSIYYFLATLCAGKDLKVTSVLVNIPLHIVYLSHSTRHAGLFWKFVILPTEYMSEKLSNWSFISLLSGICWFDWRKMPKINTDVNQD